MDCHEGKHTRGQRVPLAAWGMGSDMIRTMTDEERNELFRFYYATLYGEKRVPTTEFEKFADNARRVAPELAGTTTETLRTLYDLAGGKKTQTRENAIERRRVSTCDKLVNLTHKFMIHGLSLYVSRPFSYACNYLRSKRKYAFDDWIDMVSDNQLRRVRQGLLKLGEMGVILAEESCMVAFNKPIIVFRLIEK